MGDPAGIGPEICVKALSDAKIQARYRPIVVGDTALLNKTAKLLRVDLEFRNTDDADEGDVAVIDPPDARANFPVGIDDATSGRASARYIETAVEEWRAGRI